MKKLIDGNINTNKYWDIVYSKEFEAGKYRIDLERFNKITNLIEPNTKVVDLGCGSGEYVKFLNDFGKGCKISGLDFSEAAIKEARKRNPTCSFFVGDVMDCDKFYTEVDYAICFETIEHLSEPTEFLNTVYKILKKGGVLFLTTPYNNMVSGGKEHIYSFNFTDMSEYFERSNGWIPIFMMRYAKNLKNMFVAAKRK